jgi:hypothetical protein
LRRIAAGAALGASATALTFENVILRASVLIVAMAASATARAQSAMQTQPASAPATQVQSERMQRGLQALSRSGDAALTWSAVISLIAGGGLIGYGTWVAVDGDSLGQSGHRTALSATMLMLGGLVFANGLRAIVGIATPDEERFARFQAESARGAIDAIAIARYEGELRAEAEIARQIRELNGVAFIGTASAGAGVLVLAATSQFKGDARTAAWFWGGALVASGVWQAIANLTGASASERVWRAYQSGARDPGAAIARVTLAPLATRNALALQVSLPF